MTVSGRRRHCTEARIRASRRDRGPTRSRLLWNAGFVFDHDGDTQFDVAPRMHREVVP